MTKQDKTIKELKRVNHKLRSEMRMLEIRLSAESTKWESKFYEEAKKVDKAIEYLEKADDNENSYGDYEIHYEVKKELLDILKGVDKE